MFFNKTWNLAIKMNPRNLPGPFKQNPNNVLPLLYSLAINNSNPTEGLCHLSTQESTQSSNKTKQQIEENPYYSKYADKIKKATQTNNNVFQEKHNEIEKTKFPGKKTTVSEEKLMSEISSVKESVKKVQDVKPKSKKKLDDVVKIEMLENKTKDEIIEIWNTYYSKRDCLYASIETSLYETFYGNLKEYPSFVLPLPRNTEEKTSYEFFLMQFLEHAVHFTPLAAYHLHKEMAPVCLTIHYYPELSQTKGIVLMLGEFDSNIINIVECQCLINQLQYYYLTKEPAPKLSLHLFNKEPKSFDHMRLIKHLEDGFTSPMSINLNQQD